MNDITINNSTYDTAYREGRELMSWGPETCECLHSEHAHRKNKCVGFSGNNFERNCKCKNYRPKDNLVFLEKKYEAMLKDGTRQDKNK